MQRFVIPAFLAAGVLAGIPAGAQEIERGNPFVRPPTQAEEQARQDERTRIIVREMQPQLRQEIMQDVSASQAALEINLRRRIDAAVRDVALAAPQIPAGLPGSTDASGEGTPEGAVPEGSTFISCINGKALYRDQDNSLFQISGPDADRRGC